MSGSSPPETDHIETTIHNTGDSDSLDNVLYKHRQELRFQLEQLYEDEKRKAYA